MNGTKRAKAFCVLTAISVSAWYCALAWIPGLDSYFRGPELPREVLLLFVPPDIVVLIAAPLAYAFQGRRFWLDLFFFGTCYAALATLSLCFVSKGGWLGLALMVMAAAGAGWFRREAFRDASA